MAHAYDPIGNPADALYEQIWEKSAQIKALTAQINQLKNQLQMRTQARADLITDVKALREGLMQELVGGPLPE